jgi:hypothetical protein
MNATTETEQKEKQRLRRNQLARERYALKKLASINPAVAFLLLSLKKKGVRVLGDK